jgi:hypothetical protein
MKRLSSIVALLVLTMTASHVWAQVIATRTNTNALVIGDNEACATATFIPLNNTGAAFMNFVTTQDNQRVVISFSAECSVKAPNFGTWLSVTILLDGIAVANQVPPTGGFDNAFCTGHGNNGLDGWVSASASGVVVVPDPGIHTVRVRGNLVGCSDVAPRDDQWRIDDSSTIIQK